MGVMGEPARPATEADQTRSLRARFPRWGILFDPIERVWVAVKGRRLLVAASSPQALADRVEAAARGHQGSPDGDRTQTWRALRGHKSSSDEGRLET